MIGFNKLDLVLTQFWIFVKKNYLITKLKTKFSPARYVRLGEKGKSCKNKFLLFKVVFLIILQESYICMQDEILLITLVLIFSLISTLMCSSMIITNIIDI